MDKDGHTGCQQRTHGVLQLDNDFVSKLMSLDETSMNAAARSWAAKMSSREFTHSVVGKRISPGWSESDAMAILPPLADLAKRREPAASMYLLIEP